MSWHSHICIFAKNFSRLLFSSHDMLLLENCIEICVFMKLTQWNCQSIMMTFYLQKRLTKLLKIFKLFSNCFKTLKFNLLKKSFTHFHFTYWKREFFCNPISSLLSSEAPNSIETSLCRSTNTQLWWKISNSIELHNVMLQSAKISSHVESFLFKFGFILHSGK